MPGGQDHQQGRNLLHTYWQLKSSFGYGGVVVSMRALFPKKCVIQQKWPDSVVIFIGNATFAKRAYVCKTIYRVLWTFNQTSGLSQVRRWYGRSSGQKKDSLTVHTPFWTPLQINNISYGSTVPAIRTSAQVLSSGKVMYPSYIFHTCAYKTTPQNVRASSRDRELWYVVMSIAGKGRDKETERGG